jgi:hypothetical protein
MKLLVSPEGNFLRFSALVVDLHNEGQFKATPIPVNIRTTMVAAFYRSPWPGVMTLEIDTRSMPNEDCGLPMVYHVRAKESEVRGCLVLKIYGQLKGEVL